MIVLFHAYVEAYCRQCVYLGNGHLVGPPASIFFPSYILNSFSSTFPSRRCGSALLLRNGRPVQYSLEAENGSGSPSNLSAGLAGAWHTVCLGAPHTEEAGCGEPSQAPRPDFLAEEFDALGRQCWAGPNPCEHRCETPRPTSVVPARLVRRRGSINRNFLLLRSHACRYRTCYAPPA